MGDRHQSSKIIENPFIKPQNLEWSISLPASLNAPVSPPRSSKRPRLDSATELSPVPNLTDKDKEASYPSNSGAADVAAIEAGQNSINNHLDVLSTSLLKVTRPSVTGAPRLAHDEWIDLYKRHQHPDGRHFVIHQHDHPVAGPHYDLRLQVGETSSVSFAIMYGLPGDPNSRRLNRNATETRVHTLWSHLIESASASTGSLLIWDTGEYSILPYFEQKDTVDTDHTHSDLSSDSSINDGRSITESEKLRLAFQQRKIRLRLHGARLPANYTLTLRLTRSNDMSQQPKRPARKHRKKRGNTEPARTPSPVTSDGPSISNLPSEKPQHPNIARSPGQDTPVGDIATHSDAEGDETIRLTNAYPGATNSVGSIHQRKWYLSLDRPNSGFEKHHYSDGSTRRQYWVRKKTEGQDGKGKLLGFEAFYVQGPDVERSVVTGRLGKDVLGDGNVTEFTGRKGWRPVLE